MPSFTRPLLWDRVAPESMGTWPKYWLWRSQPVWGFSSCRARVRVCVCVLPVRQIVRLRHWLTLFLCYQDQTINPSLFVCPPLCLSAVLSACLHYVCTSAAATRSFIPSLFAIICFLFLSVCLFYWHLDIVRDFGQEPLQWSLCINLSLPRPGGKEKKKKRKKDGCI